MLRSELTTHLQSLAPKPCYCFPDKPVGAPGWKSRHHESALETGLFSGVPHEKSPGGQSCKALHKQNVYDPQTNCPNPVVPENLRRGNEERYLSFCLEPYGFDSGPRRLWKLKPVFERVTPFGQRNKVSRPVCTVSNHVQFLS